MIRGAIIGLEDQDKCRHNHFADTCSVVMLYAEVAELNCETKGNCKFL